MRKFKKLTTSVAFLALMVFVVFACEEETFNVIESDQSTTDASLSDKKEVNSRVINGNFCFYRPDRGRFVVYRDSLGHLVAECTDTNEFACRLFYRPTCVSLDPCKWGICDFKDIFDPWELAKIINPLELGSLRDVVKGAEFGTIPVNEEVIVIQYFKKDGLMISKDQLHLRTSMKLDEEFVAEHNLPNNVIPAGIYPVAYNEKEDLYNAFASMSSFPIKYDRSINQIHAASFDGSLNDLFSSFEMEPKNEANLIELETEIFDVDFNGQNMDGIYAFSAGVNDLNLIFYGDPSPQPSKMDPTPTPLKEEPNPQPMKVWLDKDMLLPQGLADKIGIKSFVLKNENLFQHFDEKTGILRVTVLNR